MDAMSPRPRSGARLVTLDNPYARTRRHDADQSHAGRARISPKGEIRARGGWQLFAAHERDDARGERPRASDYGPGGVGTHFRRDALEARARRAERAGAREPDIVHSFHYTEDVAAGLAALGTGPDDATADGGCCPWGPRSRRAR